MRRALGHLVLALTGACGAAADDGTAEQAPDASATELDARDAGDADVRSSDGGDAGADGAIEDAPHEPYGFVDAWPTVCADASTSSTAPSCASGCPGAGDNCGPNGADDCCKSLPVPGGTFDRYNDAKYPATVSDFRLDKYEVTVGRFRAFLASGHGTQANPPPPGAGAHPKHPESGWDPAWNAKLPADLTELTSPAGLGYDAVPYVDLLTAPVHTWTDEPGGNENRPINSASWYLAFAFCAWDGGRLPTEAEWQYAVSAGAEQRQTPWGGTIDVLGGAGIDATRASYRQQLYTAWCNGNLVFDCTYTDLIYVGTRPAGDGKWGQSDLFGNVAEWMLDFGGKPPLPCEDCVLTSKTGSPYDWRIEWGGSFMQWAGNLISTYESRPASDAVGSLGGEFIGFRCARLP